ncbi:MAG TPA: rhodanese-like domain-containing protein [Patescibacteria group bacterium]|nr:rhodanese-like domain-containing protein [Patescibacteria group bacterium]
MTKTISVTELNDILSKNDPHVICIDVRTPKEYREGHISGIRNIPLDDIADHVAGLKGCDTIYVHCRSGGRSAKACAILASHDIPHAVNVTGGILAWHALSYPLVRGK